VSLINDMLRDLSRRRPLPGQAVRVTGAINTRVTPKQDSRLGMVLLVAVFAGLVGGYFWLESRKVAQPVLPLQQPMVPALQAPVAVAQMETPSDSEAANAADIAAVLNISEESSSVQGFTLRLTFSRRTDFGIRDRSSFGLTLAMEDIENFSHGTAIDGISVLRTGDGVNLEVELPHPADFLVYEDMETESFDLLLTATYRQQFTDTPRSADAPLEQQASIAVVDTGSAAAAEIAPRQEAPVAVATTPRSDSAAPVRLDRQLSQEQQDRNNSQSAMALLQGGRLFEAYEQLLTFISQNPSAHQSRETLATLLLAQQEFVQARQIIDEGLTLVPNYAPFKKIKARLLLQGGDSAQALELLRTVPPQLADDPEYHELLASLYQQSGNHPGAVAAYQDLLRYNSQQGRWWVGLGISLEAQGNVADAVASYQAAQQTPNLDSGLRQYSQARIQNLGSPQ